MTPRERKQAERLSLRRREVSGSISFKASEAGSWVADVKVNGKRCKLGRYNTRAAAEAALREYAAASAATDSALG